MKRLILIAVIAAGCCGRPLFAQQNSAPNADTASVNFVRKAAKGGMMEVASGKLSAAKGQSSAVRQFGTRMVKDHSQANARLMKLAAAKMISLPSTPPQDPMLTGASGATFDQNYVQMMVKDHEEDVAEFQKAANSLSDTQIKAFASETLPVLQEHLKRIKMIAAQMQQTGSH